MNGWHVNNRLKHLSKGHIVKNATHTHMSSETILTISLMAGLEIKEIAQLNKNSIGWLEA